MDELHPVQMKILTKLLFKQTLKYGQMKPNKEMGNNTFQFHLDQLQALDLIEKTAAGYCLTKDGKKFALRIKAENAHLVKQAKLGVSLGCIRELGGEIQILMYTRLKHAYYGCQGLPAGKVEQGETIIEAAERELNEETNLVGKPQVAGIFHYHIFSKDGSELLDDLLLFLCRFTNPIGELIGSHEGRYEWVNVGDLPQYLKKPFQSKNFFFDEVKNLIDQNKSLQFFEKTFLDNANF